MAPTSYALGVRFALRHPRVVLGYLFGVFCGPSGCVGRAFLRWRRCWGYPDGLQNDAAIFSCLQLEQLARVFLAQRDLAAGADFLEHVRASVELVFRRRPPLIPGHVLTLNICHVE